MKGFEHLWRLPPIALFLASTDVHVWHASLDLTDSDIQRLQCTLSYDEVQRARRFYFPRDRRRFTVARGGLRRIFSLMEYCVQDGRPSPRRSSGRVRHAGYCSTSPL